MDINVALLAEEPLAAQISALSPRLAPLGNSLLLDPANGPFPHLTLYLTGFEDDSVDTIPVLIEGNLRGFKPPQLTCTGIAVSRQGTVLVNVLKTPELDELHRWMLHKLNSFRMRAKPTFWNERRDRLSPRELTLLDQLGFPHAQDAFSPHFTIGKIEPQRADEARALLKGTHLHGNTDCIAVGTVGAHGSLTQILGKARFS